MIKRLKILEEKIIMNFIRNLGATTLIYVYGMGRMAVFLVKTLLCALTPPFKVLNFIKQIRFIGAQSVFLIAFIGAFTGMVLALQGYYNLNKLGSVAFLGPLVALSIIKELGPVLAAIMVTARAGSAMTAEIGIMRITNQIDAIEMMGLNPLRYLVVPALVAAVICMPLLASIFDLVGIFGGYLVAVKMLGVDASTYLGEISNRLEMKDILEGIYKSISFGVIISWVSCYKGYYTGTSGFGAEGVSRATTEAVVLASAMIVIWDYFMTALLFQSVL
jgi:phospholipid/cholesterol/gamma-HCH transport system permease protein